MSSFKEREDKWSKYWYENKIFESDRDSSKEKFFITFPFPYMNGSLHLGHAYSAGRLDVLARYKRMKGYNVLFPWAWHWTGEAVMGVVHRLEDNDEDVRERIIKLDGVEPEEVDKFLDPIYLVRYFTNQGKEDLIRYGLTIDWSREFHTTDLHPLYSRFVEWQIRTLFSKGYIVRGPYAVVWCPKDESPTGDHDRLKGEGVRPEEYVLVKFKLEDSDDYLVAGTFRPETIFGCTNIWVDEKAKYVLTSVDGENWIVSEKAVEKLSNQMRKVSVKNSFFGEELIGRKVVIPYIDRVVPILPADFVDPELVTGIVYSVPGHAPYDYLALRDLQEKINREDRLYDVVIKIKPISIIKVEGYGDYPAIEIVDRLNIKSQLDFERADEATEEIYGKEFHEGVMKDNCFDLSDLPVKVARDDMTNILLRLGLGDKIYDLSEEVICRCGTKTFVKIIEDQWLLKYSNDDWKNRAKRAIDKMVFFPKEMDKVFNHYIDWYRDWPCTRKTGLGTPFPLDKDWIVETLTDSTVYMAFYIISKYYNNRLIPYEKIDDTFFNYIFFGVGNLDDISKKTGIDKDLLTQIRQDFLYWYPVDIRGSGKDLVGNHLTFYIFHHVAIFDEEYWPKGISVNGFTMLNGEPMSKSLGNFISLRKTMELFGADAVRVGILTLADGIEDPDVRLENLKAISLRIENLPKYISNLLEKCVDRDEVTFFDKLLMTRLKKMIDEVESYLDLHRIGVAGKVVFYIMPAILEEYTKLDDNPSKSLVIKYLESWIKLLSLYTPYISEEIWHNILNKDSLVCNEKWPSIPSDLIDENTILYDNFAKSLVNDIDKIGKLLRIDREDPITIKIYVADKWKYMLIKDLLEKEGKLSIKEIVDFSERLKVRDKSLQSIGKIIIRQWYDRYMKHRDLLKIMEYGDESRFLRMFFNQYTRLKFPKSEVIVLSENEAVDAMDVSKASKSLPLIPSIIMIK